MWRRLFIPLIVILTLGFACGGSGGARTPKNEFEIPPEGRTVVWRGLTLIFPPDAVEQTATIRIEVVEEEPFVRADGQTAARFGLSYSVWPMDLPLKYEYFARIDIAGFVAREDSLAAMLLVGFTPADGERILIDPRHDLTNRRVSLSLDRLGRFDTLLSAPRLLCRQLARIEENCRLDDIWCDLYNAARANLDCCGNGLVESFEGCDTAQTRGCRIDGFYGTQTCAWDCGGWAECHVHSACGNGLLELGEYCDDGLLNGRHAPYCPNLICDGACATIMDARNCCGNGIVEEIEECDSGAHCNPACRCPYARPPLGDGACSDEFVPPPTCGNGRLDGRERCDGGDGCLFYCDCPEERRPDGKGGCIAPPVSCGNQTLDPDEECDDGQWCLANCTCPFGTVPDERGGCAPDLICGNGELDPGEECDGGAFCGFDCRCPATFRPDGRGGCEQPVACGNGRVDTGEECDLGHRNGDEDNCCTRRCTFQWPGDCRLDDNFCSLETCNGTDEVCRATGTRNCDDGAACTEDFCNAETGRCDHVQHHEDCDDSDFCNGPEECWVGYGCVSLQAPVCADDDPCTLDTCDPDGACSFQPLLACDGQWCPGEEAIAACDGGAGCTPDCTCPGTTSPLGDGSCAGDCGNGTVEPGEECDLGANLNGRPENCCGNDCRIQSGECEFDGLFCTLDLCDGATQWCYPSGNRDCDDGNAATRDACNELNNRCEHRP